MTITDDKYAAVRSEEDKRMVNSLTSVIDLIHQKFKHSAMKGQATKIKITSEKERFSTYKQIRNNFFNQDNDTILIVNNPPDWHIDNDQNRAIGIMQQYGKSMEEYAEIFPYYYGLKLREFMFFASDQLEKENDEDNRKVKQADKTRFPKDVLVNIGNNLIALMRK